MFNWVNDDDHESTPEERDAAEAFTDVIQITKSFSALPANCHRFMSASDTLLRKYLSFQKSNKAKASQYIDANHTITTRHLGARGDATHEDICMFAPEHGVRGSGGGGIRPHRRW